MSDDKSRVEKYRLEAASIRQAAEIVRDERFRQQLLSIAEHYEALATSIDLQLRSERAHRQVAD